MVNRKLIRPNLSEMKSRIGPQDVRRRHTPHDQTNAESFYYMKQMNNKTPMVLLLNDGEEIHGVIEWYDRNCIKINRQDAPNLLIPKHSIKYMYKEEGIKEEVESES